MQKTKIEIIKIKEQTIYIRRRNSPEDIRNQSKNVINDDQQNFQ